MNKRKTVVGVATTAKFPIEFVEETISPKKPEKIVVDFRFTLLD